MSGTLIVLSILLVLSAVLLAVANQISESLVRARARRLPVSLAPRMEEEWLAELSAVASRPGKLAFAIALTLTPRRAFVAAGEEPMAGIHDRQVGRLAMLGGWKSLLVLPTVLFGIAAYAASFLLPVEYASEALILVNQQDVSGDIVDSTWEVPIEDRLEYFKKLTLSRSTLVAIINKNKFELGGTDMPLDQYVEELRSQITVTTTEEPSGSISAVTLRFVGSEPNAVQQVTESLTQNLLRSFQAESAFRLVGSQNFLQLQLELLATRLTEKGKELARARATGTGSDNAGLLALEHELLETTYRTVFAKLEYYRMANALATRGGLGQSLRVQDPASFGERVGPNRQVLTLLGASIGLALGIAAFLGPYRKQRRVLA